MHTDPNPKPAYFVSFIVVRIYSPKLYFSQNEGKGTAAVEQYGLAAACTELPPTHIIIQQLYPNPHSKNLQLRAMNAPVGSNVESYKLSTP